MDLLIKQQLEESVAYLALSKEEQEKVYKKRLKMFDLFIDKKEREQLKAELAVYVSFK